MTNIPELFYPYRLKDIVLKLRNEKNLNEQAYKNLNIVFYTHTLTALLCMFLLSLFIGHPLLLLSFAIVIGIIRARYKLSQKTEEEVLPYSVGEIKKGQIISKDDHEKKVAKYQYINQDDESLEKELRFKGSFERLILSKGPVDVYLHREHSIPFIESRFRSSCLNQKRIDAINPQIDCYDLNGY